MCWCVAAVALALSLATLVAGCGGGQTSQPWTSANGSVASQQAGYGDRARWLPFVAGYVYRGWTQKSADRKEKP
jgi:hypothetical protein